METAPCHFVLVHGAGSGAWCWYKVATLLKSAGHRVTALDMGGCGVSPTRMEELRTIHDYIRPLMDFMASLGNDDKWVVLIGHSFGGFSISLAMGQYPRKIAVAVFVSAFMPPAGTPPAKALKEFYKWNNLEGKIEESDKFKDDVARKRRDDFMTNKLYQSCSAEVLELARLLGRPSRMFVEDLVKETMIADEYVSVDRVFVICGDDKTFDVNFQRWMVEMNPPKEVKIVEGADHMAMLSKPDELYRCLLEICRDYHRIKTQQTKRAVKEIVY